MTLQELIGRGEALRRPLIERVEDLQHVSPGELLYWGNGSLELVVDRIGDRLQSIPFESQQSPHDFPTRVQASRVLAVPSAIRESASIGELEVRTLKQNLDLLAANYLLGGPSPTVYTKGQFIWGGNVIFTIGEKGTPPSGFVNQVLFCKCSLGVDEYGALSLALTDIDPKFLPHRLWGYGTDLSVLTKAEKDVPGLQVSKKSKERSSTYERNLTPADGAPFVGVEHAKHLGEAYLDALVARLPRYNAHTPLSHLPKGVAYTPASK